MAEQSKSIRPEILELAKKASQKAHEVIAVVDRYSRIHSKPIGHRDLSLKKEVWAWFESLSGEERLQFLSCEDPVWIKALRVICSEKNGDGSYLYLVPNESAVRMDCPPDSTAQKLKRRTMGRELLVWPPESLEEGDETLRKVRVASLQLLKNVRLACGEKKGKHSAVTLSRSLLDDTPTLLKLLDTVSESEFLMNSKHSRAATGGGSWAETPWFSKMTRYSFGAFLANKLELLLWARWRERAVQTTQRRKMSSANDKLNVRTVSTLVEFWHEAPLAKRKAVFQDAGIDLSQAIHAPTTPTARPQSARTKKPASSSCSQSVKLDRHSSAEVTMCCMASEPAEKQRLFDLFANSLSSRNVQDAMALVEELSFAPVWRSADVERICSSLKAALRKQCADQMAMGLMLTEEREQRRQRVADSPGTSRRRRKRRNRKRTASKEDVDRTRQSDAPQRNISISDYVQLTTAKTSEGEAEMATESSLARGRPRARNGSPDPATDITTPRSARTVRRSISPEPAMKSSWENSNRRAAVGSQTLSGEDAGGFQNVSVRKGNMLVGMQHMPSPVVVDTLPTEEPHFGSMSPSTSPMACLEKSAFRRTSSSNSLSALTGEQASEVSPLYASLVAKAGGGAVMPESFKKTAQAQTQTGTAPKKTMSVDPPASVKKPPVTSWAQIVRGPEQQEKTKTRPPPLVVSPAEELAAPPAPVSAPSSFGSAPPTFPQSRPSPRAAGKALVHGQIVKFAEQCQEFADVRREWQEDLLHKIGGLVTKLCPGTVVDTYGSYRSRLAIPVSDIDLVIGVQQDLVFVPPNFHLQTLAAVLRDQPWAVVVNAVENSMLPVIRLIARHVRKDGGTGEEDGFSFPQLRLGSTVHAATGDVGCVKVDISVWTHVHRGIVTTMRTEMMVAHIPCLLPLTVCVKQLLAGQRLNDPYSGGLSGYALVLLVVLFVHEKKVISADDLCSTLVDFLDFYGNVFDPKTQGLSFAHGVFPLPHQSLDPLILFDPEDLSNNVGRNCFCFPRIQAMFRAVLLELQQYLEPVKKVVPPVVPLPVVAEEPRSDSRLSIPVSEPDSSRSAVSEPPRQRLPWQWASIGAKQVSPSASQWDREFQMSVPSSPSQLAFEYEQHPGSAKVSRRKKLRPTPELLGEAKKPEVELDAWSSTSVRVNKDKIVDYERMRIGRRTQVASVRNLRTPGSGLGRRRHSLTRMNTSPQSTPH